MLGLVRDLAHSGAHDHRDHHAQAEAKSAMFVDDVTVLRRGRMGGTGSAQGSSGADTS